MHHELRVLPDARALAAAGAEAVAARVRAAATRSATVSVAVSGGRTPRAMLESLARADLPWDRVVVYQVDERVAPEGDPDRNLTELAALLGATPARIVPMPVESEDLEAAARDYADGLPARLDLVHLGLGADGHTASLVPGDAVLDSGGLVAVTGPYHGRRRLTMTLRAFERAEELLWLVAGGDKRDALAALLAGDASIPAGRVRAPRSLILADAAAMGEDPVQREPGGDA